MASLSSIRLKLLKLIGMRNIFACNGILFNHESPRRGETFVIKITKGIVDYYINKNILIRQFRCF